MKTPEYVIVDDYDTVHITTNTRVVQVNTRHKTELGDISVCECFDDYTYVLILHKGLLISKSLCRSHIVSADALYNCISSSDILNDFTSKHYSLDTDILLISRHNNLRSRLVTVVDGSTGGDISDKFKFIS